MISMELHKKLFILQEDGVLTPGHWIIHTNFEGLLKLNHLFNTHKY
jgi:hypothetical protein